MSTQQPKKATIEEITQFMAENKPSDYLSGEEINELMVENSRLVLNYAS